MLPVVFQRTLFIFLFLEFFVMQSVSNASPEHALVVSKLSLESLS